MTSGVRPQVREAISSAIKEALAGMPIDECGIVSDLDSTGDEAIFVDICYLHPTEAPIDPLVETRLLSEVRKRLLQMGERRFPYIRHHLAPGQKVVGW